MEKLNKKVCLTSFTSEVSPCQFSSNSPKCFRKVPSNLFILTYSIYIRYDKFNNSLSASQQNYCILHYFTSVFATTLMLVRSLRFQTYKTVGITLEQLT